MQMSTMLVGAQMASQCAEASDGTSHSQQKQQVCLAFPYQFRKLLYSLNTFINLLLLSSFWFMSYAFDHYYLIIIIIRASIFEVCSMN